MIHKIRKFDKGMVDSYGRGKEPEGSFASSYNLIPTKVGSLETVHGYSKTLAALPTAFPVVRGTGTFDISSFVAKPIPYSSEIPSAYDDLLYFVVDNQGSPLNHYMLGKWFNGSTTAVSSPNSGFVLLDERKEIVWSAACSIPTTNTIVITTASAVFGLSTTNDYYNHWTVEWSGYKAYVTDYAYVVGTDTATITVLEDLSATGAYWAQAGQLVNGQILTIQRWFHSGAAYILPSSNRTFTVSAGRGPGKPFSINSRLRGCGGAYSDASHLPWISQYINRTWFQGVSGVEASYQGTYVDDMECVNHATHSVTNHAFDTTSGATFTAGRAYRVKFTLEYDGYLESPLFNNENGTTAAAGTETHVTWDLYLLFARLSKRVTAVNIYVEELVSNVWSQAYFIKRIDLLDVADSTWAWAYTGAYARVKLAGATTNSCSMTVSEWVNHGGTYYSRTGRTQESSTERNIVSWYDCDIVSGRAFFGNVYDPNAAQQLVDEVRYTPIDGNGNSNFDIIPADRLFFSMDVSSGDPGSIRRIVGFGSKLYVFKNSQIFSYMIGAEPTLWSVDALSEVDGLYSLESVCKVPDLGVVFADADALKLIVGNRVYPLTGNISNTYYGLAAKSSIICWYDKIDRAICMRTAVTTIYRGYFDMRHTREDGQTVIPWYPVSGIDVIDFVYTERDGTVGFCNDNAPFEGIWEWGKAVYNFDAAHIYSELMTNPVVPDESSLFVIDKVVVIREGAATDEAVHQDVLLVDGTSSGGWTGLTDTHTNIVRKVPVTSTRMGRKFQFTYGYDSGAGSSMYSTTGKLTIHGIDLYLEPVPAANQSR